MRGHRKRVLVTGGAGFLGSHLCDILVSKGYDVLCLDNFYTGVRDNISHLLSNPHFELIRHDVTFPLYVEVDEIYNFACPASPIHYQFDEPLKVVPQRPSLVPPIVKSAFAVSIVAHSAFAGAILFCFASRHAPKQAFVA